MTTQRFRVVAFVLLACILLTSSLLWPVPMLGFVVDTPTGQIVAVDPASPAAREGLQPGDRIVAIYDFAWDDINTRLLLVPLPWVAGTPTPLVLQRADETRALVLSADTPSPAFQLSKLFSLFLALTCWATGYLLGSSPRAAQSRVQWVAWFWLWLGVALSSYQLANATSYVLSVGVLWLLSTIMAPLAVWMHAWYPSRPRPLVVPRRWAWILFGLLQGSMILVALAAPSTTVLLSQLHTITLAAFLVSFFLSAGVLCHVYQTTTIAHIQRQIRLIGIACLLVGCSWSLLLIGRALFPAFADLVPGSLVSFVAILIPLAYLIGGSSPDLLRIDTVMRRMLNLMIAVVLVSSLILVTVRLSLIPALPTLIFLLLFLATPPLARLLDRLSRPHLTLERHAAPLHHAAHRLGQSLHMPDLAQVLADGVRAAFGSPPLAIYARHDLKLPNGTCLVAHGLSLPPTCDLRACAQIVDESQVIMPVGAVQHHVQQQQPEAVPDELSQVVFHDALCLWGFIRDPNGALLGLVLIGPRGDLDPYRDRDRWELQRLLTDAGLAFANSARYAEQVQANQTIAWLYQHMQKIEAQTTAELARIIHDEVLNESLRMNLESLRRICPDLPPGPLRNELHAVLDGEEAAYDALREICLKLNPSTTSDPYGMVAGLRTMIEQIRPTWSGAIHLTVQHDSIPLPHQTQREIVRIAREAIVNAIKHADATIIRVSVSFPTEHEPLLTVRICDNGTTTQPIAPRDGHMGLHFMQASATAIHATLAWERPVTGGTEVLVQVHREHLVEDALSVLDRALPGRAWGMPVPTPVAAPAVVPPELHLVLGKGQPA